MIRLLPILLLIGCDSERLVGRATSTTMCERWTATVCAGLDVPNCEVEVRCGRCAEVTGQLARRGLKN